MKAALEELFTMQDHGGCFPSQVTGRGWVCHDRNGFVTALALRLLSSLPESEHLERIRSRGLNFLSLCRSPELPGAYGFWPYGMRPAWAPDLPPDLDDTAMITVEMLRGGRLTLRDGLRTVHSALLPFRARAGRGVLPPWVVPGAFLTWAAPPGKPNVVDCCVNANAAALMALVRGEDLPGYAEATETVLRGIAWAGSNPVRLRAITPFYPSICSLREAIAHALACGVETLRPALDLLAPLAAQAVSREVCSSAYGAIVWRSAAIDAARALLVETARA